MEHCFVDRGRRLLNKLKTTVIRSYSCHVDGIFYHHFGFGLDPVEAAIENVRYPRGKRMFKVKKEPRHKNPDWPQRYEPRSYELYPEGEEWRILTEADGGEDPQTYFAKEILKNGGGLLNCVGGTGKTFLVRILKELLEKAAAEADKKIKFLPMAMRHASKALLPDGDTVAHALSINTPSSWRETATKAVRIPWPCGSASLAGSSWAGSSSCAATSRVSCCPCSTAGATS